MEILRSCKMRIILSIVILHFLGLVHTIEVTPNSGCSSICMNDPHSNPAFDNSSHTLAGDLVCNDWELSGPNSTRDGRIFHDCIQCQENSTAHDAQTNENDLYWFLCKSPGWVEKAMLTNLRQSIPNLPSTTVYSILRTTIQRLRVINAVILARVLQGPWSKRWRTGYSRPTRRYSINTAMTATAHSTRQSIRASTV